MHCGLMVRDGARAPLHHEGSVASHLSPEHAYEHGPEMQLAKQGGAGRLLSKSYRALLMTPLRTI
jgi:hypothetical protein